MLILLSQFDYHGTQSDEEFASKKSKTKKALLKPLRTSTEDDISTYEEERLLNIRKNSEFLVPFFIYLHH
jgi:hypothetical protein